MADAGQLDANTALRAGTARLAQAEVTAPAADALELLALAWRRESGQVRRAAIMREQVPAQVVSEYDALLVERARRVPLQHLTGVAHFHGLELAVGPGVFLPRPETELLVELALSACAGQQAPTIIDLCTGSGAIAFALKTARPDARVLAVELSPHAHAWATHNQNRLGLDVEVRLGAAQLAFEDLLGAVDVVVSNPPYIPLDMVPVEVEVRDHDPQVALFGGSADGLRIPLEVADRAAQLLRPGGTLLMEHADSQGDSLPAALAGRGWCEVRDVPDLTGRPRHTVATHGTTQSVPCN